MAASCRCCSASSSCTWPLPGAALGAWTRVDARLDQARWPRVASRGGDLMASDTIRVGNVEILHLSDGKLEFDLCNFFPTIPVESWRGHEAHLHYHHVRFNLGSYLIRSDGRTVLVD